MTLKELMLGNIQSNQNTAVMQLGAQTAQKAGSANGNPAFGDILGSKMAGTDRQSSIKRNNAGIVSDRKSVEPAAAREESKPRFVTYREASDNSLKASSAESASERRVKAVDDAGGKPSELKDDQNEKTVQDNAPNNMTLALAQVLGLNIQELQKLLKEAGITSESFNNMKNVSENVNKLSQLLGLDNEQQDTLMKLLQMTGQTLGLADTAVSAETQAQSMLSQDTVPKDMKAEDTTPGDKAVETLSVKLQKAVGETETEQTVSDIDSMMTKLNEKIKLRLNEFGNKLEKDQSSAEAELKQMLLPLLDKAAVKVQEPIQQVDAANASDTVAEPEKAAAVTDSASAKNGEAGRDTGSKTEKEAIVLQPAGTVKEQPQTVLTAVQSDKAVSTEAIEKTADVKSPVQAKEIISQVIEKAKVILAPEKSEMIMDLKPDSLGKISLKVVTENGMVMAKFVAESQQVKQVLESNMQLLKDSLERQGMNVQGFSVSVRQDSNGSSEKWTQPDNGRNRGIGGTDYRTAGIEGVFNGTVESTERRNPYTWGGSTINLTA